MAKHFFRRVLPNPEWAARHRFLARLGPRITAPQLWYVNRRAIAVGLAGGVFFGLLLPTMQMPVAALWAILLRCNLPSALAGTFVSNPVTFVPIYLLAYRIGAAVLDVPFDESWTAILDQEVSGFSAKAQLWWSAVYAAGVPLATGLLVVASSSAALVYSAVLLAWRTSAHRRYRQRPGSRGSGSGADGM